MKNKTLNDWRTLNGHIFWYRLCCILLFIISGIFAFGLMVKMVEDPIVIIKEGETKSYFTGERIPEEITEEDVEKFHHRLYKKAIHLAGVQPFGHCWKDLNAWEHKHF